MSQETEENPLDIFGSQDRLATWIFGADKVPVVGMVHLLPLPGSPRWGGSMEEVLARACEEADHPGRGRAWTASWWRTMGTPLLSPTGFPRRRWQPWPLWSREVVRMHASSRWE